MRTAHIPPVNQIIWSKYTPELCNFFTFLKILEYFCSAYQVSFTFRSPDPRDSNAAVISSTTSTAKHSIENMPPTYRTIAANPTTTAIHTIISKTTNLTTASSPPTAKERWTKEELFGLLGVLCVVLVPCIGLALRYCLARCRTSMRNKNRTQGKQKWP